jgi:hypothetical protein
MVLGWSLYIMELRTQFGENNKEQIGVPKMAKTNPSIRFCLNFTVFALKLIISKTTAETLSAAAANEK